MPNRRRFCTSAIALYRRMWEGRRGSCRRARKHLVRKFYLWRSENHVVILLPSGRMLENISSVFYITPSYTHRRSANRGTGFKANPDTVAVNHEKSKKLSKRSSLSSNRIFSKWPRTLAERRPHKTKKWPIVDSILVPHVSSTILKWKQRKTPSKEYERSCGNSKRTSTWGNEQKKGWYRSSSRNAPILLPAIELVSGNTKKHKHSTSCSYLLYFWLLSIFYTLTLISKSNASEFKVFSTLFPVQIGIESVLILIVRQIARELTE